MFKTRGKQSVGQAGRTFQTEQTEIFKVEPFSSDPPKVLQLQPKRFLCRTAADAGQDSAFTPTNSKKNGGNNLIMKTSGRN